MFEGTAQRLCSPARGAAALAVGDWARARACATGVCTDTAALEPSLIPTRHFQRSLPRLPVPVLSGSLRRYAAAVKPLVPPGQYARTVEVLKQFELQEGPKLQEELIKVDRANQHTSFLSSDFFESVLRERDPIPLRRSRTLLVRSPGDAGHSSDMLSRATLWVYSSVVFYKRYLDNTLYPEVRYVPDDAKAYYQQDWFERTVALCPEYVSSSFLTLTACGHAFPTDLSQCDNLFNSTRAPGVLQDEVRAVGFTPHIVVQCRGRQFAVTVADAESNPLPEDQIYARLRAVVQSATAADRPSTDVGIFTTLPRTEWNGVRTTLMRNAVSQRSLEVVDSSMFVLNLDDDLQTEFFHEPSAVGRQLTAKGGNRWWDKSISVNVDARGGLSVSYEESWGDGDAVRRYVEDTFQHSTKRQTGGPAVVSSSSATEPVKELRWDLTPDLQRTAAAAERRFAQELSLLDVGTGVVANAGSLLPLASGESKGGPTGRGTSPAATSRDAVVNLALQLAWWRLNGSTVSSVQPVNMNSYRRGRIENLCTATAESQAFTIAMATAGSAAAGTGQRETALCREALEAYAAMEKDVSAGSGVHGHLFALACTSQRMYGRAPALFRDPSYKALVSAQLQATPEGGDSLAAASANPVANGYGVTYTVTRDNRATHRGDNHLSVIFNVSAWKGANGPRHSAADFVSATMEAMSDIGSLLTA